MHISASTADTHSRGVTWSDFSENKNDGVEN